MTTTRQASFFIPRIKRPNFEIAYEAMKKDIKYQMGWVAADRRIESLTYVNNRKKLTARVGEIGEIEHRYEVVAILEAPLYVIVTRTKNGNPGPTILVDTKDVLEIQDFKAKAEKLKAPLLPITN